MTAAQLTAGLTGCPRLDEDYLMGLGNSRLEILARRFFRPWIHNEDPGLGSREPLGTVLPDGTVVHYREVLPILVEEFVSALGKEGHQQPDPPRGGLVGFAEGELMAIAAFSVSLAVLMTAMFYAVTGSEPRGTKPANAIQDGVKALESGDWSAAGSHFNQARQELGYVK